MIPLNGKDRFRQGVYRPQNPKKYIGKGGLVYRSSYELRFFRWCDLNSNCVEWASEAIIIPYTSPIDGKVHRYYTDGIIALREGNNIVRYIIEIKPKQQTIPPAMTKRKRQSTIIYETAQYAVNTAKWKAAEEYCKRNGFKFQILTEEHLGIK